MPCDVRRNDMEAIRRAVVTGIGAVTPLGLTVKDTWDGLRGGKNGIAPITLFDTEKFKAKLAAEVRDFDPGRATVASRGPRGVGAVQGLGGPSAGVSLTAAFSQVRGRWPSEAYSASIMALRVGLGLMTASALASSGR